MPSLDCRSEFCTYFDRHYLVRGLAMYESLRAHCAGLRLWVLCMDAASFDTLRKLALPDIVPIALGTLEAADSDLLATKPTRSMVEYYFTCTPCLPLFLFKYAPEIDTLTYLDADLFFFGDPGSIREETKRGSIGIIEHRFPPHLKALERAGRFNVGWLSFRRDADGLACLREWRLQCLDWCYDVPDGERYADQKYLDRWPDRFRSVAIVQHRGANVAPWNVMNYRVSARNGRPFVDDQPLLFFHFHGLKEIVRGVYETGLSGYGALASRVLMHDIYAPYISALHRIARDISLDGSPLGGRSRTDGAGRRSTVRAWMDVFRGRYLCIWHGFVIATGR